MFLCLSCLQDIRLLNAGKPAQHAAEIERDLDKADNVIRLFFNDVQILKDGRHPQAEHMYRRLVLIQPNFTKPMIWMEKQLYYKEYI